MSEEQKEATDLFISSTNYLSTLVNGILDQTQLESGQFSFQNQTFNIRQMTIVTVDARMGEMLADKVEFVFFKPVGIIQLQVLAERLKNNKLMSTPMNREYSKPISASAREVLL